jgi:hypothetical protein
MTEYEIFEGSIGLGDFHGRDGIGWWRDLWWRGRLWGRGREMGWKIPGLLGKSNRCCGRGPGERLEGKGRCQRTPFSRLTLLMLSEVA